MKGLNSSYDAVDQTNNPLNDIDYKRFARGGPEQMEDNAITESQRINMMNFFGVYKAADKKTKRGVIAPGGKLTGGGALEEKSHRSKDASQGSTRGLQINIFQENKNSAVRLHRAV